MKQSIFNYENYLMFSILSLPILLITGPFLPDFILSLCIISFIFFVILKKQYFLFNDKFFFIFLVFFATCILSSLLSDYKEKSIITSLGYLRFGILIIVIKFLINKNKNFLNLIYKLLITIFFALFFDSIIQKIFGFNVLGFKPPYERITSFFNGDIKLGGYISRFLPLLIALCYINKAKKITILILLLISTIITILSGERTSFLMVIMFLTGFVIISDIDKKIKTLIMIFPIIIFFILISFSDVLKVRVLNTTLNQLNFLDKEPFFRTVKRSNGAMQVEHRDSTFVPRVYYMYFQTSFKILKDNFLIGSGPRTYKFKSKEKKYFTKSDHSGYVKWREIHNKKRSEETKKNNKLLEGKNNNELKLMELGQGKYYISPKYDIWGDYPGFTNISGANSHPHNTYLQLLSETGVIGMLIIFLIFLYCSFQIFSKRDIYFKCIMLGIAINLFPMMFSGNFFNNWLSIIYFFPIGFLLKRVN